MNHMNMHPYRSTLRIKTSVKDESYNNIVHYVIDLEKIVAVHYSRRSKVGSVHLEGDKTLVMKWSGAQRVMKEWELYRDLLDEIAARRRQMGIDR